MSLAESEQGRRIDVILVSSELHLFTHVTSRTRLWLLLSLLSLVRLWPSGSTKGGENVFVISQNVLPPLFWL